MFRKLGKGTTLALILSFVAFTALAGFLAYVSLSTIAIATRSGAEVSMSAPVCSIGGDAEGSFPTCEAAGSGYNVAFASITDLGIPTISFDAQAVNRAGFTHLELSVADVDVAGVVATVTVDGDPDPLNWQWGDGQTRTILVTYDMTGAISGTAYSIPNMTLTFEPVNIP